MERTEVIQTFIDKYAYRNYLEIGCQNDINFNAINCNNKVGVDPEMGGTLRMTSDEFFKVNAQKFDCIFIDGLHHSQQVYEDIKNSLKFALNPGGVILLHDMLPKSKEQQNVPRTQKSWTGDSWKAFVWWRMISYGLDMFTIDTCTGIGVMISGKGNILKVDVGTEIDYERFVANKHEWMNIKTVEEFKEWMS